MAEATSASETTGWRPSRPGSEVLARALRSTRDDGPPSWRGWGTLVLALILVAVLVLPSVLPETRVDFASALGSPSVDHPFGTDQAGRDLMLRTVEGLRISLLVGIFAAVVATLVGVVLGAAAAGSRLGGARLVDAVLMRLVDGFNALPHLVVGIVIVAMLGPSLRSVVISIAVTHWTTTARLVRAEMLALSRQEFVDVAVGLGANRRWVTTRHLLGHVGARALLAGALMVPHAVFHESALSFLGLGLPGNLPSLGTLIEQSRLPVMAGAWWTTLFPGLALVSTGLLVFAATQRFRPKGVGRG